MAEPLAPQAPVAATPGDDGPRRVAVPGYLPALDGLRAVAVAAVVAYHLGELRGGFLGVDLFFVISGFLITRLALAERERTGRIDLRSFWIRRFKRLVPALLVVVTAVAVASRAWLPAWRLTDIRDDALAALAYVANWRFVASDQSYFASGAAPSPLRHTWSLAIEEQLYVAWPLVIVAVLALAPPLRRRTVVGATALVLALASAGWMVVAAAQGFDLSRIYYGTDTRAFALLAGAWLASWWDPADARPSTRAARRSRRRRWSTVGAVAAIPTLALVVLADSTSDAFYRGGFQAMAILSVLLVAGVAADGGVLAALGHPVLVWVGRRSYGIYLWSWPVQVMAMEHFRLSGWSLHLVVAVASLGLAAASYALVEEPIRTGVRPMRRRALRPRGDRPPVVSPSFAPEAHRTAPRVVLAVMAIVAVTVTVGTASGAPSPPEYLAAGDVGALAPEVAPLSDRGAALLAGEDPSSDLEEPIIGADESNLLVDPDASVDPSVRLGRPLRAMVAGDSVGWSLGYALSDDLTSSVEVDGRGVIGCGLMPTSSRYLVGGRGGEAYFAHCDDAEAYEVKGLLSSPDVVVLWVGAWEVYDHEVLGTAYRVGTDAYADLLEARLQRRIDRIRAVGALAVLPIVPCFGTPAAFYGEERTDADRVAWVNERVRAVAERNVGFVRLIDPSAVLCDDDGTARTETPDGVPLREDGTHLDPPAAVWFWNSWLSGQLGAALEPVD